MLDFKQFIEAVISRLQEVLGEGCEIAVDEGTWFNDAPQTSLIITWDKINEFRSHHMEPCYSLYREEMLTLEDIVQNILELLDQVRKGDLVQKTVKNCSYESVRENLRMMLINEEANRERLLNYPHKLVLDLAVIFYAAHETDKGILREFIENSHMQEWGIDVETLYQDAEDNMYNFQHTRLKDLFGEMYGSETAFPFTLFNNVIWLLQKGHAYGACAMLDEEELHDFATEHGRNLYIIPSSMHEVLIMLTGGERTAEDLAMMVKGVNETHLQREDLLSNSIYLYDRQERKLSIAVHGKLFPDQAMLS